MSLENENRLRHALHNEEVCRYLQQGSYNDWVVTTAFYAALHFVRFHLFPREVSGENFPTFDHYCRSRGNESPHKHLLELVGAHAQEIAPEYKWLYDSARSSRYSGYRVDDRVAQRAVKIMGDIKTFCTRDVGEFIAKVTKAAEG